jgi:hypothetical protein
MPRITFVGAGSTVFAKNVLGDAMLQPSLHEAEIALYDIDAQRLDDSMRLIEAINRNCNDGRAKSPAEFDTYVSRLRAHLDGWKVDRASTAGAQAQALDADFMHRFGIAGPIDAEIARFEALVETGIDSVRIVPGSRDMPPAVGARSFQGIAEVARKLRQD